MWQPIETAPKDQFLLLCGPSGYTTIPFIFTTGRTCSDYHLGRWIGHANDDLTAWGFEPTHWATLSDPLGAQKAPSFADAYQGAMEEVAIWKKRALEAEELNRKFIAEINGPTHMGEPAQPMPNVPDSWKLVPAKHPTFDPVDLQLSDGSVLCGCVPQLDGDYWWEGPSGEVFIDPKYASVTHWRLAALEAKP